jgi:hypothetical protein
MFLLALQGVKLFLDVPKLVIGNAETVAHYACKLCNDFYAQAWIALGKREQVWLEKAENPARSLGSSPKNSPSPSSAITWPESSLTICTLPFMMMYIPAPWTCWLNITSSGSKKRRCMIRSTARSSLLLKPAKMGRLPRTASTSSSCCCFPLKMFPQSAFILPILYPWPGNFARKFTPSVIAPCTLTCGRVKR